MLLETQQLQDAVLEARCRMAVTANRLVRLDNPIAAAHLAAMQVQRNLLVCASRVGQSEPSLCAVCTACSLVHARHKRG